MFLYSSIIPYHFPESNVIQHVSAVYLYCFLFDFCCISVVFILFPHWHLNPHLSYLNITNVPSNSSFASSVRLLSYIETALERRQTMYLSDIHTHSIASGHGTTCTISDMAKAASKKGLKLLGISDHGPGTLASGTSSYFRSLPFIPEKDSA